MFAFATKQINVLLNRLLNVGFGHELYFSITFDAMHSFSVSYKKSSIHYSLLGQCDEILLCIHGFAENADSFFSLAQRLSNKYTLVLIDMPLHGKSIWKEDLLFTVEELAEIINTIPVIANKKFSVMGYSMGGRIALTLYQYMPQRIKQLVLAAPDGIIINFWYRLATQTSFGNKLFYIVMKNPSGFFFITKMLKKLSLINTGVYKYADQYLKTANMRERLYNIWTIMRKMKPDIPFVKKLVAEYKTPVILIYGKYDKVIRYTTGEKFCIGIEEFCTLHILDCGHRVLHEKNAAAIAAEL